MRLTDQTTTPARAQAFSGWRRQGAGMDEALEVVDLLADSGFEGVIVWLLRLLGLVAILAGVGLWLLTEVTVLLWGGLIVVGLVLVVVPGLLVTAAELFG